MITIRMVNSKGLNEKGLTLIELIIFIVAAGIISIGLMGVFLSLMKEATTPDTIALSNFLGQQKMEELTKHSFIDSNMAIHNQTYISADIPGYEWSWEIEYIDGNSLDYSLSATTYKKISVKVRNTGGPELQFYTIVTKRYKDMPEG
ncbi:MAG: type IV pilus modification PilV family protein [bacterium]